MQNNTFGRFSSLNRRSLLLAGALAGIAVILGASLALIGPVYTLILLIGLAGAFWIMGSIDNALWSVVAIIALLPYATLPVKIVITPTFLDLALGVLIFLYIGEWLTGHRRRLTTTPVHAVIVLFMLLSVFSFVAGLRYAGLTSTIIRRFTELLLSMSLSLILVDILKDYAALRKFTLVVLLVGLAAAMLAVTLWVMPDDLAASVLSRLSVIGYPDSGIIRYVEENPELPKRAIATSADPNALGGLLVMLASLVAPQTLTKYPITGKRWHAVAVTGLLALALLLTFSRGSMLAFGVALTFIAMLRYRKLLLALLGGGLLVLVLPWTQFYVRRLVEGFQFVDLATQMRIGEYTDALRLISRYPLLGVGFSGTPDIDLYLGVANVYLTIASNMGILGLLAFLVLMVSVFGYAGRAYRTISTIPELRPILLGLMAGIIGTLFNGIFDHYFFNLAFHPAVTILWIFVGLTLSASRIALQSGRSINS